MAEPKLIGEFGGVLGLSDEDVQAIESMVDRNDRNSHFQAQEKARRVAAQDEDYALDQSMADRAMAGAYGIRSQVLAKEFMAENGRTPSNLLALRLLLAKIEGRQSG